MKMPQERKKEHKCSHHAASSTDPLSWWQKFHFSGKVIMCSVLFGLGLVLIGGLLLAIGADRHDEENNGNLNEVQNKAPMSIVGPIIMGIGGFTVIVGIIMCLFETNICHKRQPDSRPLIEEQNSETAARNTDATTIPSTSQKREKHRHKKSSSPRKHKAAKKSEQNSNRSSPSPTSMPIDMHRSLSRDLTSSDKFLTPPSSLVYEHPKVQVNHSDAENQTSASLLKSFTSSGKTWDTSTEFQTPASSFQDNSGSFDGRDESLGSSPELKELNNDQLKNLKHEFVTPKNSSAEIIDAKSNSLREMALTNLYQAHSDGNIKSEQLIEEIPEKLSVLNHDFVTPMNSYVDQPIVNALLEETLKEDNPQTAIKIEDDNFAKKSSEEKSLTSSFDSLAHKTDAKEEIETGEREKDKRTNESNFTNTNYKSKETVAHDLKEPTEAPDLTLTADKNLHSSDNVVS